MEAMFTPRTPKIEGIYNQKKNQSVITKLDGLLIGKVNVYIDYANVRPWAHKLKWHVNPKRLKQFLDSFPNINSIKFYEGELIGDAQSQSDIKKLVAAKYDVRTKPVKIMKHSINATSVSRQSPDLLKSFIKATLLRTFNIATVEYLNKIFSTMNAQGILYLEDRKCNFDVEIATDMRVDHIKDGIDTFVLWSGDSDFADPIKILIAEGKKVILFATAGRVSRELNELVKQGLFIFDIADIKEYICQPNEQTP